MKLVTLLLLSTCLVLGFIGGYCFPRQTSFPEMEITQNSVVLECVDGRFQIKQLPKNVTCIRDRLNQFATVFAKGSITNVNGSLVVRP